MMAAVTLKLPKPHPHQHRAMYTPAKRIMIKAGRRGGKTTFAADRSVRIHLLKQQQILYAAPEAEQTSQYWELVKLFCRPLLNSGHARAWEGERVIRLGKGRIKVKTAHDPDTLRSRSADLLILDEFQLMHPDAWKRAGAPMLIDRNGTAIFIYTPPRINAVGRKLAAGRHARDMWNAAEAKGWETIRFSSRENPYLSKEGLAALTEDMTARAIRAEIDAEDEDENPNALWTREIIRYMGSPSDLRRIVVGVDPSGSATGDEVGLVVCGIHRDGRGFVLEDASAQLTPKGWASRAVALYDKWEADRIVAERNFGGDMVLETIRSVDPSVPVKMVTASRGKMQRAEPVAAKYEQGQVCHAREFAELEDEMLTWDHSCSWSPNRMDALVWCMHELMVKKKTTWIAA